MEELWEIEDTRTGKRCGVGGWPSKQSAEMQIESWWLRHCAGGRPDISADLLRAMKPRRVEVS